MTNPLHGSVDGTGAADGGSREALAAWAQSAQFPRPVRWGEVEAAVLARHLPAQEWPAKRGPRGAVGFAGTAVATVVLGATALWAALNLLSPIVGLAAVLGARATGIAIPVWVFVATMAFVMALMTAILIAWGVFQDPRHGRFELVVTGAGAAVCLVAAALLRAAPFEAGEASFFAGAAAVVNLVALVRLIAAPRYRGRSFARRHRNLSDIERRYVDARAYVLDILVKQRKVADLDGIDLAHMNGMPLRSWHELDQPGNHSGRTR